MAAGLKCREMVVEFASKSDAKILQVAVIRSGNDCLASRFQEAVAVSGKGARIVDVFNDFSRNEEIACSESRMVCEGSRKVGEPEIGIGKSFSCRIDSALRSIDAVYDSRNISKAVAKEKAVPATEVENCIGIKSGVYKALYRR